MSLTAALIGIVVAIVGFFVYQSARIVKPDEIKKIIINSPSPTPQSSIFLTVDKPMDEEVVDSRTLPISGKTIPDAKIIIVTQSAEEAAVPAKDGSFSTTITIDIGENIIEITSLAPNGEVAKVKRVITYSTENF